MGATILLVDDDDGFKMLIEKAITKSRINASVKYVWDVEQAMSYLSRHGRFSNETAFPPPALVLLDLKMPRENGFELLKWKSEQPELKDMPFVVLSSSDLEKDKKRAAELGAQHYLMKPMGLPALIEMVQSLETFWRKRPDSRAIRELAFLL